MQKTKAQISLEYMILTAGIISIIGLITATTFNIFNATKENYTKKIFEETKKQIKEKIEITKALGNGTKISTKTNQNIELTTTKDECIIKIGTENKITDKIQNIECKNSKGKTITIEKQNNTITLTAN
ncbi:MAG: class III signal peptide-containing protein [Candidatus Diapherotrites archaeon]